MINVIKKKGAKVRKARAKSKKEGKLDLDWESWMDIRKK